MSTPKRKSSFCPSKAFPNDDPRIAPTTPAAANAQSAAKAQPIRGVKHVIAVASGKGGVCKSTVAVNLALGLQAIGLNVGIVDADIYGPSQPRLLGVSGKPEVPEGKVIKPLEGWGLKVMSMGFLVDEGTPVVWRGPVAAPDSQYAGIFREIAARAWSEVERAKGTLTPPPLLEIVEDGKMLKAAFPDGRSFDLPAEFLRVVSPSAEVQGHALRSVSLCQKRST